MTAGRTRVLVVEDSLTMRRSIAETISADPELTVVAEAADGRSGVELCCALRPDAVTMDMVMPRMTGLAATEQIMANCPTPILILSASLNRREVFGTFDALAAGAVDVLEKPLAGDCLEAWRGKLRAAVKMAARIRVIRHPRARLASAAEARRPVPRVASAASAPRPGAPGRRLVVIGGSTGAPGALAAILRQLPSHYPLPLVAVIHISPLFSASLCQWLDAQCGLPVRLAVDGEPLPKPGASVVVMPPADLHLVIEGGRVRLRDGPERHSCRPSVDVLFESVARELGDRAIGCLLTGMGADGAAGLLAIRGAGGDTLVQDEETSEIYGMPRAAVALGAAARVLPLAEIAPALVRAARFSEERAVR